MIIRFIGRSLRALLVLQLDTNAFNVYSSNPQIVIKFSDNCFDKLNIRAK